jgi:hypothetical protein
MTFEQLEDSAIRAEQRADYRAAVQLYLLAANQPVGIERKLRCNTAALRANVELFRQTARRGEQAA